ncbi:MAG: UDP-N-acetylmuramoyl-L-alanyl-D-glutamate--2,6-diaminopimelate ligase [Rhodothermales bacterium]|nr:UDP-N-acetylmuramoyl-L-alanyl-D-glutamate--2,6-diaminopimelate ligase [Rhodothermales bacterium]
MTRSGATLYLDGLAGRLADAGLVAPGSTGGLDDVRITAVTADSREAAPESLFVAVPGTQFDGHDFVEQAVAAGASALVVERPIEADVPQILVSDARRALAQLGAALAGDPAERLAMAAVTGTNGKTTTAWLIAQALNAAGHRCGYIGTIGWGMPDALAPTTHTTPDPVRLHQTLADLEASGCRACAMEASSHAIDQERTAAIPFAAAAFTNLTRDHLDYHGTVEAYLDAKARLFESLPAESLAVLNTDDEAGRAIAGRTRADVLTYGTESSADVRLAIVSDRAGLRLKLDGHDARFKVSGSFNAYNLAAAYGVLAAYGLDPAERIAALGEAEPAPGRFEIVPIRKDRVAVIDYAHTPDALRNVLEAARGIVPAGAQLWCVFGCGGERDEGKRPIMGGIAEALADRVVVTSDNPRREDPQVILDHIREGVRQPEHMQWIVDRAEAVNRAVQASGVGDVVVVSGKGPESYQVIGTERIPYSDMAQVKSAAGV